MTSRSLRKFKHLSYPILFFFCWTNIGIYNLAHAASNSQKSGVSSQKKDKTTEERFQEALEKIREAEERAGEKIGRAEDVEVEEDEIKKEKGEIENLDVEIKKEFKETEDKIKDLPEEIKKRHKDFIKKYEENLKELKTNLDEIEKAKTKTEKEKAHKKTKDFLEKTKPPKKHIPLDPNKLPHRTPEIKKREPRTKPEEFKEIGSGKWDVVRGENHIQQPASHTPIMVASNGPLTGLVSELPTYSPSPLAGEGWGEGKILLAANTTNLPTPADLSETIEVQFTPDIKAKAAELNYNPVKIYEWVRNNIEYVPTYGSIQGADMCLQTKQCNDMDTASLLIALLRASNISARYVYGTIELPIDKAMNWVGGFTNKQAAVNFIASGGVPIKAYASGGKIAKVQLEHVWVEAYVDMIPSGGAVHKQGDTWVPLDGSYKQYIYKTGLDLYSSLSFNGDQFMNTYIADTQDITPYQQYGKQMISWLDANMPTATIEDILGAQDLPSTKVINQQTFPYLLGTLAYKVVVKGGKYSETPDSLRHKATLEVAGDMFGEGGLSITKSMSELSGKRVTLSYIPATISDENLIAQYGGDMLKVPPYMLNVKPVIKIDGVNAATGGSVGMGTTQAFTINLYTPAYGADMVQNNVVAGTYSAITIQAHKTPVEIAGARMEKLQNNSKNIDAVTLDDLLGELLYAIGLSYFHHLTFENDLYAKTFQMTYLKQPSEAITTLDVNISYLFGVPRSASQGGLSIDVDRDVYSTASLTGDLSRSKHFMNISGMTSSAWEHKIFEAFVNTPSVSAMKLLKYASQQGIPIYTIDSNNIGQLLSTLQISSDVKTEIQNAVNAGKKVIVSQSEVQYYDWKGIGYVILDPTTGVGAYMISGGLAGGGTATIPTDPPIRMDKNSYLYNTIIKVLRHSIMVTAIGMVGTLYGFGCKDPFTPIPPSCKNKIDCSGLVGYVYNQAGITVLGTPSNPKNAQMQYDFIVAHNGLTSSPQTGDLIFFQNTDDRNEDGKENDGITHVGIYLWNDVMVSAGVTLGVEFYPVHGYFKTRYSGQDAFVGYGTVFPSTNP